MGKIQKEATTERLQLTHSHTHVGKLVLNAYDTFIPPPHPEVLPHLCSPYQPNSPLKPLFLHGQMTEPSISVIFGAGCSRSQRLLGILANNLLKNVFLKAK